MDFWSTALKAVGAGLSAFGATSSGGGNSKGIKPFKRTTTSGNTFSEQVFNFDKLFEAAMRKMAYTLNDWGLQDRDFFKQQYLPFQQQLINTNANLLPVIAQNSGESLRQSLKDLVSNEPLKRAFSANILGQGAQKTELENQFVQEIKNLPTEQEAVGQALAGVEARFGQAGAELRRKLAGSGRGITQSSLRNLEIQKAATKARAAEMAKNQNRQLRLNALSQGVGLLGAQQGLSSTQLLQARGIDQQAGNLMPQVGGVKQFNELSDSQRLAAGLYTKGAEKTLGINTQNKQASWFTKGYKQPTFFNPNTNKIEGTTENNSVSNNTLAYKTGKNNTSISNKRMGFGGVGDIGSIGFGNSNSGIGNTSDIGFGGFNSVGSTIGGGIGMIGGPIGSMIGSAVGGLLGGISFGGGPGDDSGSPGIGDATGQGVGGIF